jgi:hypothetical protein
MATTVNRLTNANIYVNGNSLLGKAEEITLPVIKQKMSEHKALGMVGSVEFPSGIDKLEAKIKWNSFYADIMKQVANPFASLQIQVRANLENYTASGRTGEVPVVCIMTSSAKDFPMGNFKQHDNVEAETNLNVTYCKLEIDGEVIMEIDVLANIYKVDGTDLLATYRANTGA